MFNIVRSSFSHTTKSPSNLSITTFILPLRGDRYCWSVGLKDNRTIKIGPIYFDIGSSQFIKSDLVKVSIIIPSLNPDNTMSG